MLTQMPPLVVNIEVRIAALLVAVSALSACQSSDPPGVAAPRVETAESLPMSSTASPAPDSAVNRVEITRTELAFDGREFGSVGQYEWVDGELFAALDPTDPNNAVIVNLDKAPRNSRGRVEYSAEFRILKPVDMTRGNGAIFYDVMNRGAQRAFNLAQGFWPAYGVFPRTADDVGDGFQLALGYTMVWSGWQASATGERIGAGLPIATNPDGTPIRAWRTTELRGNSASVAVEQRLYPTVAETMPEANLYRRTRPHAEPELLPRESWSFATCEAGSVSVPSNVDVCLEGGFSADAIYYLVHEVQDPIVMGIGFAAVRDAVSFFRYDTTQTNPLVDRFGGTGALRNVITTAVAWGQSQPGRFIRDFIYQGFNRDPAGRPTFDGAMAVTAGARKTFTNYEFANPGRFVRFVDDHYYPGDQFPFGYATMLDPVSGRVDGILARCSLTETCPRIMHFDSANELWAARGSLVTTDPLGTYDASIPDNVRIYQWASTQHNQGGLTGYETQEELEAKRAADICKYLPNNAMVRENRRALVVAMHEWIASDTEPPPSRYNKIADGALVRASPGAVGFPSIRGVPSLGKVNELFVNDYRAQPAAHTTAQYGVLVPRVDEDGNDVAGIRSTDIQVPLATHVGWNYRKTGRLEDEGCGTRGSSFPFATAATDRGEDSRLSLEERYGTHDNYVELVRQAVRRQQDERLMLPHDGERLINRAEQRDIGLPRN